MKISLLAVFYFAGALFTFVGQTVMSPNATLALMLARSLIWPIFWATGWPHGTPLLLIG